ncbi:hypothetical protein PMZ80_006483 [Knufia obscura]|uniref:Rhodopsin domain-containing protein n=2 Tax=Knufia TaxID=430999 RepID=A0AAN8EL74_9EURO|nr:hypothetical protein PMZ80_006483 [Knufia obscura]KAK5953367.1 hypothetical protein OHC33_005311 [Knufia fluminis]
MEARAVNPITATPETTRVVVSNYTCMAVTLVVLIARAALSAKWRRKIGLDDIFLYLALVAGIIESALTEQAVRRGLGTFIRPGNSSRLKRLSELVYASDLFFLIAMLLAKLAVVRLVYRMSSRSAASKSKLMALQICIAVWGAFSIPAIAFQCGAKLPWLYIPDRCTESGALWYPTLIFSILTDAWLVVCAWSAVPEMQVGQKQRQVILGLFSTRFLTCILCVVQLAFLAPALKNGNQPRAMPNPFVLKSFVMNASIITAALPVLYSVLGTYTPTQSAQATIYNPDAERQGSPLDELKTPSSVVLPNPKNFDGIVKETEVKTAPTLGNEDFSAKFSLAFNKEIEITSKA